VAVIWGERKLSLFLETDMIDIAKLKVGYKFFNKTRDCIGVIVDIVDDKYHYRWIELTNREFALVVGSGNLCRVDYQDVLKYTKVWHEITPLMQELL
jgi:hypothetical protein